MTPYKDRSRPSLAATVIIIPAFNEGEVIGSVIEGIRAHCEFPIFVIDDASTDDTIARAMQAGATVIPLAVQLGALGGDADGYALRSKIWIPGSCFHGC